MLTLILGKALKSIGAGTVCVTCHRLELAIRNAGSGHQVTPLIVTTLAIGPAGCQAALVDDHACVTIFAVIVGAAALIFRHVVFTVFSSRNTEAVAHVIAAFLMVIGAALWAVAGLVYWHAEWSAVSAWAGLLTFRAALTIRAA